MNFRQRQPITTFLQLFFPSLLVLAVVVMKFLIPPSEFETCQFRARHNPSSGPLPMLQSFLCNLKNNCGKMKDFEDNPSYPGSKLDDIVEHIEPILYNDTVQEFSIKLPGTLRFINSTAFALNDTIIMNKYVPNETLVKDIFYDPDLIRSVLTNSTFDNETAEIFLEASIKMGMVSGDLASFGVPLEILQCSSFSISMFLPKAKPSLVKSMKNVCQQKDFLEMLQTHLNYNYLGEYLDKNIDSNLSSSAAMNPLISAISMMQEISSIFTPSRRKRQAEVLPDMSNVLNDLSQMIEGLTDFYNDPNVQCLLSNTTIQPDTLMDKISHCNATQFITPVYEILKSKFPIWKNVSSLLNSDSSIAKYEKLKQFDLDVNRLIYLMKSNKKIDTGILRFSRIQKRQIGEIEELVNDLNLTMIIENLENWRKDEFNSMDWMNKAQERIENIIMQLSNIASSLESVPVSMMQDHLSDPEVLQLLISSSGQLLLSSVTSVFNETGYFLQNTDIWENYTSILQQLGEKIFNILLHNVVNS